MKALEVPALFQLRKDSPLPDIAAALDKLPPHDIAQVPWPKTQNMPVVKFVLAYNPDCLFLKYYVQEETVQARYLEINSPVYKDSCVEFFIAFQDEANYYNLEFNCLGICLAGFGRNQQDRKLLPKHLVSEIKTWPTLQSAEVTTVPINWQLTLVIPTTVFAEHSITNFAEEQAHGNFYKCGDELPHPHYLTWSPIDAPEPDFHLPEFFGELTFISPGSNP